MKNSLQLEPSSHNSIIMASGSSFLQSDNAEIGDGREDSIHVANPDSSSWSLESVFFAANSTEAGSSSYSGKSLRKQMLKRCHLGSNPKIFVSQSSDQIHKYPHASESLPDSEKLRSRSLTNCLDLEKLAFDATAALPFCYNADVKSRTNSSKINKTQNETGLDYLNYFASKEPEKNSRPILSTVEVDHIPRKISESEQRSSSAGRVSVLEDVVGFGALNLSDKTFQKLSKTTLPRYEFKLCLEKNFYQKSYVAMLHVVQFFDSV